MSTGDNHDEPRQAPPTTTPRYRRPPGIPTMSEPTTTLLTGPGDPRTTPRSTAERTHPADIHHAQQPGHSGPIQLQPPRMGQLAQPSDHLLRVPFEVNGRPTLALIDTGASQVFIHPSLVPPGTFRPHQGELRLATTTHNGRMMGHADVKVSLRELTTPVTAVVVGDLGEELVLRQPWLEEHEAVLEMGPAKINVRRTERFVVYAVGQTPSPSGPTITLDDLHHDVPPEFRSAINKVLHERRGVFATAEPLRRTTVAEHSIPTTTDTPIYESPRGYGYKEQRIIREQVTEMLHSGVIEPSNSPFNACIVLAPKRDGTLRFCTDFRPLNAVTISAPPQQISIETAVSGLGRARVFSTLYLKSGYWQVPIKHQDREKTAFTVPDGRRFQYRAMPFGLKCAPATFQAMMTRVLGGYLGQFALAYLDDVIVFSETWEDHCRHLALVLERLATHHLTANPAKCHLGTEEVEFLGHRVNVEGSQPQTGHLQKIATAEAPRTRKQLQRFIGLINWLRVYIPDFSRVIAPLTDLLSPQRHYHWGSDAQRAFEEVKSAFTRCHTLARIDPERPLILQTDASALGLPDALSWQPSDQHEVIDVEEWEDMLPPGPNTEHLSPVNTCLRITTDANQTDPPPDTATDVDQRVMTAQRQSTEMTRRRQQAEDELHPTWRDQDGRIMHRALGVAGSWKTYVPPEAREAVLRFYHDHDLAGHPGTDQTRHAVSQHYHWPGVARDVREYVRECEV
ncbi:uncharacterized protein LOC134543044 [Bacillus rossius redtenbacheri]|uniref:uncharacterized protein LOC134543044 n=1 Tax=Bacillus rossius redtenbacheri TaxID=93214 RepID=UPI002FDC9683